MAIRIQAVYKDGVIKPKTPLSGVAEDETITITLEKNDATPTDITQILKLCRASDEGLTDEQREIVEGARLLKLRD